MESFNFEIRISSFFKHECSLGPRAFIDQHYGSCVIQERCIGWNEVRSIFNIGRGYLNLQAVKGIDAPIKAFLEGNCIPTPGKERYRHHKEVDASLECGFELFCLMASLEGVSFNFIQRDAVHERSIEVHIFDFHDTIYNKELRVSLVKRTRGEVRFASKEQLVLQLQQDAAEIKDILKS